MSAPLVNWILIVLVAAVALATGVHVLLTKRDPRTAFGWIAVCLLFPVAGPVLYTFFGINRIRTRAKRLGRLRPFRLRRSSQHRAVEAGFAVDHARLPDAWSGIGRISDTVARRPLVAGNEIVPLYNGDQAFPAMLQAIEQARRSLYLSTYIFQTDETGGRFIDALARASARGVDVKVIIDGFGELYAVPRRAGPRLERLGVRCARFLPPRLVPPTLYLNLRNHRKLLVADGRVGFTGGMNISDRHLVAHGEPPARAADLHFRVTGPVVGQIEHVFVEDWNFCTGEQVGPPAVPPERRGHRDSAAAAICRTVVDGPSEDLDSLEEILLGAISAARRRVAIMTPYFLPSRELVAALHIAVLRGVEVALILPAHGNLPFVHWAMRSLLWEVIQWGVRVYYQPPPFAHTKLFLIDDFYAHVGSANIDPRSLRLNFELTLETFDEAFSAELARHFTDVRRRSRLVSLEELDRRPLAVRLRDAVAWLFSPYM